MKTESRLLPAACLVGAALWVLPMQLQAAGGTTAGGGSACTVTVYTTNEDGSTDNSVRPYQAACRSGQRNGDIEYYNPYTDTYHSGANPRIEPLVRPRQSGTTRAGSRGSQGGDSARSSGSQARASGSGAPCTASGTSSKAIKKTRSTASGRPCSSPLK
ncbi:MAG: hypothetical protein HS128_14110 [Ideonella sp.]|nr:hypothetical protein [Ideonella sp.]MCC7457326.1 hypothetical protein [Nitrospira sp.]